MFCNTDKKEDRPKMHQMPMTPNVGNLSPSDRSRGCFKKMVLSYLKEEPDNEFQAVVTVLY